LTNPTRVLAERGPGSNPGDAASSLPPGERERLLAEPVFAGEIRAHALDLASKDPATAAVVLKAWLAEQPAALPAASSAA
jgi:hypothetical protein